MWEDLKVAIAIGIGTLAYDLSSQGPGEMDWYHAPFMTVMVFVSLSLFRAGAKLFRDNS